MTKRKRLPKSPGGNGGSDARSAAGGRTAERYRLALPTMMWELGGVRDQAVPTETVDISRGGLFLSGQFPLQPVSMISFEVKLPPVGDQPGGTMVGQATVIRNDSAGKGRVGLGAIIHQCEVWPATRPTIASRETAQRKSSAPARKKTSSEKRTGDERRSDDRRDQLGKGRRAAALATERRRKARRAAARRNKS